MPNESEWQTRKERIDSRLKKLGWKIVPFSDALDLGSLDKTAVEELPTANGPRPARLWRAAPAAHRTAELHPRGVKQTLSALRSASTFEP